MKKLEVAGAIFTRENKVLCAQRGENKYEYISHKYEFPGGKLELGETPKQALQRELMEEMNLTLDIEKMEEFYIVEHQYPDFFVKMHCFIYELEQQEIRLNEHLNIQWRTLETIGELDWAEADIPVLEELIKKGI